MLLRPDDCYRDLLIPFFDDAMMGRITDLALARIEDGDFIRYDDYVTPEEFSDVTREIPEIDDLCASCAVRCSPLLMFLPPGFTMDIHTDRQFMQNRKTVIGVIAHPALGIADTNYYLDEHAGSYQLSARWERGRPKLLNIMPHHNVSNGDAWRANLQLSINAHYDETIGLISEGRLFSGYDCSLLG